MKKSTSIWGTKPSTAPTPATMPSSTTPRITAPTPLSATWSASSSRSNQTGTPLTQQFSSPKR